MTTVTGVQLSEYLSLDPRSPYTLLFQRIYDVTKPEILTKEDGEIEDEDSLDSFIEEGDISKDENKENYGEIRMKKFAKDILQWKPESNYQNQNVPAAKLPPHLAPPPMFPQVFPLVSPCLPFSFPRGIPIPPPPLQGNTFLSLPPPPHSTLSLSGVADARQKILQADRGQIGDARDRLDQLAKTIDGRMSKTVSSSAPREQMGNSSPLPPPPQQLGYDNTPNEIVLRKLIELDPSPKRIVWLTVYRNFMVNKGMQLTDWPFMYKEPLDLYRLYQEVWIEGGFEKCTATKSWNNVVHRMTKNHRQPLHWRMLQDQYRKFLLSFETQMQMLIQSTDQMINRASIVSNTDDHDLSQPIDMIISNR